MGQCAYCRLLDHSLLEQDEPTVWHVGPPTDAEQVDANVFAMTLKGVSLWTARASPDAPYAASCQALQVGGTMQITNVWPPRREGVWTEDGSELMGAMGALLAHVEKTSGAVRDVRVSFDKEADCTLAWMEFWKEHGYIVRCFPARDARLAFCVMYKNLKEQ
jgi:hypothetical protein